MGPIVLRKLSRKSKMGCGAYATLPIQQLIDENPKYIRWIYYNRENITFMDDILDEVGITSDVRISKPGKSKETYEEIFREADDKINDEYWHKMKYRKQICIKSSRKERLNFEKQFFSKSAMQRRNQGKGW